MLNNFCGLAGDVLKVKMGLVRLPLFISWSLTNRCPTRCAYCVIWQKKGQGLKIDAITQIIEDLATCGTRYISFTGGEPFFKESLDVIVRKATDHKMIVNINSTGFGIQDQREVLGMINSLTLSLDGPPDIHNEVRGSPQAYDKVVHAVRMGKEAGVKVKLTAVVGRHNVRSLDAMLDIADELNCPVTFQPATYTVLRGETRNPLALSDTEYFQVLDALQKKKREGCRVANSFSGLKGLQNQISHQSIKSWGGKVFFRIETDGSFHICPHVQKDGLLPNALDGIMHCIRRINDEHECLECLSSARMELNCILSYKFDSILNQLFFQ